MKWMIAPLLTVLALGPALASEHPEHPNKPKPAPAASKSSGGELDGKSFTGQLVAEGKESGDADEITFKDGTFVSSACMAHGFQATAYKASASKGVVTFHAEAKNSSGETMRWKGTVNGEVLEATAVHESASGKTTYRFEHKPGAAPAEPPKK